MRPRLIPHAVLVTGAIASAGVLAGCGDVARAVPAARLGFLSPKDGTQVYSSTVRVSGTVTPASARVLVSGRPARVAAGRFSIRIGLAPGINLIDVLAGATRAGTAMRAIRIDYEQLVRVPSVTGDSPSAASAQLRKLGLTPQIASSPNPFDFFIPLSNQVCSTAPAAGAKVHPETTVTLSIGKFC